MDLIKLVTKSLRPKLNTTLIIIIITINTTIIIVIIRFSAIEIITLNLNLRLLRASKCKYTNCSKVGI
jgi:hypothetical protein